MKAKALGACLLAGVFALLSSGTAVNAATLTETEAFSLSTNAATFEVINEGTDPTVVDLNNPPSVSQTLTFNRFNSGLGTLTGGTITLASTYGATVSVTVPLNAEDETVDFFADADVDHDLSAPGIFTTLSSAQQFSATCSMAAAEADCSDSNVQNGVGFNSASIPLVAALAFFTGAGTYDLTATVQSLLGPRISPDNGTDFADNTTFSGSLTSVSWSGEVSVVYTYFTDGTAVSAPLSLYLVGAGLAAAALWRRYRG